MTTKTYTVKFRRKREGKTDYKKRVKLLLSNKKRVVVRRSLKNMYASIVEFKEKGDHVIVGVDTKELRKLGWNYHGGNMPSAYLAGFLLGKKAKKKGVKEAVLDIGLYNPIKKSRIYAVVAGLVDAGLNVPHDPEVIPKEDRLSGSHIKAYAENLKKEEHRFSKQFSNYTKRKIDPLGIDTQFKSMKAKIAGENT